MRQIWRSSIALMASGVLLAACQGAAQSNNASTQAPAKALGEPSAKSAFPKAERPVSKIVSTQWSTEPERDIQQEAQTVMDLAGIAPGMSVADIGAGEGYYTVRLAARVGPKGRVLAQDIDEGALSRLGARTERDRLTNVSIELGTADDPGLPKESFDRIFMIHMYHEIAEPYAFLWHIWPALKEGGQIAVVDLDRPSDRHGIAPAQLSCEFASLGFRLSAFHPIPGGAGYYAQFAKTGALRPEPGQIKPCRAIADGAVRR